MINKDLKGEIVRLIHKAYEERDALTLITVSIALLSEYPNLDFEERIRSIFKVISEEDIEHIRERLIVSNDDNEKVLLYLEQLLKA